MATAIALVDCDNFFVSCERLFRPDLQKRPVLILSSNDGCVISRSEEAKKLGIQMGVPYFRVREICQKHGVVRFSSNFELYRDISDRVMSVLRLFSNNVEVYSIDEAFLLFHGTGTKCSEDSFAEKGKTMREKILREVGIPVSIGISHTKTLAKCASHLAKPRHEGKGYEAIFEDTTISKALKNIPVDEVWGIGRRLAARLEKHSIHTAHDLVSTSDETLRKVVHLPGVRTAQELRGTPHFTVASEPSVRKSLLHSQSFGTPVHDLNSLQAAVLGHVRSAVEILRKENILARKVTVIAHTKTRNDRIPPASYMETLQMHSNDTLGIAEVVSDILKKIHQPHVAYKKAGVLFTDIVPVGTQSKLTLFDQETNKNETLMHTLDTLRSRFGDVVKMGGELGEKKWSARREHLSPRYTTRWSDVRYI